jgi:hypothetical protein
MSSQAFLTTLPHALLKKLTQKLNLHVGIKNYTKLSKDDLVSELAKRTTYTNGKITVSIPVTELNLPEPKTKKPRKPRAPKQVVSQPIPVVEMPQEELSKRMADFITNIQVENVKQESNKLVAKQDLITEAIAEIVSVEKDDKMAMTEKKSEMLSVLESLQESLPEIDLKVLSKPDEKVNENLDDGLTEFTKKLFASFYADELDELDALSFNFGNTDIKAEEVSQQTSTKVVTAVVDEDTGMIFIDVRQPDEGLDEDPELMQAAKMMDRERTQRENIMKPIQEEQKPMLKNYIDELNDQLAELDEMSFNFGQPEMIMQMPDRMPSPVKERMPSPPMIQEIPKEKRQIPMQTQGELIDDPGQWISDNLTPTRRFKTPNERHKWAYYPKEEIEAINDMGVLDYLKDSVVTFKGLSQNHTKETLFYINAEVNSILNRQEALLKNRGRGRPAKGTSSDDIENRRQKRITDVFDNLPTLTKQNFTSIIKRIDGEVTKYMREYAKYEAFDNSYKPFAADWEDTKEYTDITDKYYFNDDLVDLIEENDIDKSTLSSWIDLHIERKNMLLEFNKLIAREEKIKKRDPKLLGREASKIQAGVRGFLTRKKLREEPIEKSDVVKQKEESIEQKYKNAVANGLPTRELLAAYLETPKGTYKSIVRDINNYFDSKKVGKKEQDAILKRLNTSIESIRKQKMEELYKVEFDRKDFNVWRDMLLKAAYASSGLEAKIYNLKKLYKKAVDDQPKQAKLVEDFARLTSEQKVNRLLANYYLLQ